MRCFGERNKLAEDAPKAKIKVRPFNVTSPNNEMTQEANTSQGDIHYWSLKREEVNKKIISDYYFIVSI